MSNAPRLRTITAARVASSNTVRVAVLTAMLLVLATCWQMGNAAPPLQNSANDAHFNSLDAKDNETRLPDGFVAVVAGATGATGRWIVKELAEYPGCKRVVALSRKPITDQQAAFGLTSDKIVVNVVDFAKLVQNKDLAAQGVEKCELAFCCLGSSPNSEESDFIIPKAFADACSTMGVQRMGLISSAGADPNSMFGYFKLIGRREVAYEEKKFPYLSIFRPGMLERGDLSRFKERWVPISKTDTKDLARFAMQVTVSGWKGGGKKVFEMAHLSPVIADLRFKPRTASRTM